MSNVININDKLIRDLRNRSQAQFVQDFINKAEDELSDAKDLSETKEILEFLEKYKHIKNKYQSIVNKYHK